MSEWGDLFTNLYNQFVLRDLLSMILTGFTIFIVSSWFFYQGLFCFIASQKFTLLSLIFVLSISYFIGILLIGVSDCFHLPFRSFYTLTQNGQREKTKQFFERLCDPEYWDTNTAKQFIQIRERYIVFMQACGNFASASIISMVIIGASSIDTISKTAACFLFSFLFLFSMIGYFNFKDAFKCWDSLILKDKTS